MNLLPIPTLAILGIAAFSFVVPADTAQAQCITYSPGYAYATGGGASYYPGGGYGYTTYAPPVVTYAPPVVSYPAPVYVERPRRGFSFSFGFHRPHHYYRSHHYYGHHHHYRHHYRGHHFRRHH